MKRMKGREDVEEEYRKEEVDGRGNLSLKFPSSDIFTHLLVGEFPKHKEWKS